MDMILTAQTMKTTKEEEEPHWSMTGAGYGTGQLPFNISNSSASHPFVTLVTAVLVGETLEGGQMSLICGIGDGGCTPCTLMLSSETYIFTMSLSPTSY